MGGLRFDPEDLVVFVGTGLGADDLITVRGARVIAEAGIIIWASSLIRLGIVADHKPDAEVIDSASIPPGDLVPLCTRARDEKLLAARVHTGDPDIYGATAEQRNLYAQTGIPIEAIPDISVFSATAARVDSELTLPEVAQSMILTRLEGGRTPIPKKEAISSFAAHGTTMSIYLSVARNRQLEAAPLEGGYPPETPCVIGYRMAWSGGVIWRVQLEDLSATIEEHKLWKYAIMLISPALATNRTAERSYLYHPGFRHEYRDANETAAAGLREHGTTTYSLENEDNA